MKYAAFLIAAILALNTFASKADAQVIVRSRGASVVAGGGGVVVQNRGLFGLRSSTVVVGGGVPAVAAVGVRHRAFFAPRVAVVGVGHGYGTFAARSFAGSYYAQPVVQSSFFRQSYGVQALAAPAYGVQLAAPAPCGGAVAQAAYAPALAAPAPSCGAGGCLPSAGAMLQRFGY